jgi:tRNA uridine 5-carboxymethylaminomethyl modification enzyme
MAGINAHNKAHEKDPFILKRSEAYIGVLVDDLITKGTQEPYRMFTSRAEYRILLRQDNADLRLTERSFDIGLATEKRLKAVQQKKADIQQVLSILAKTKVEPELINDELAGFNTASIREKIPAINLLRRPQLGINELRKIDTRIKQLLNQFDQEVLEQAEIHVKYETYIEREQKLVEKIGTLEDFRIKTDFDYDRVKALSAEAREKLKRIKPETIGQASRISGVSPSDISVLTIYMGK